MPKVKADFIWFNGELVPWEQANVHVMSHALHYGSSVFEGIRAYDTPNGSCLFRLEAHIRRLFDSAKVYRMKIPYTADELIAACKNSVRENNLKAAYLRPLAFLGDVGMGLRPPLDAEADVMIAAFPWESALRGVNEGIDVGVSSWNRIAPNTLPTGAKAGGNYLSSQLISREAQRHGYHEGIALDINNYVSEGAGQNIFMVRDGVIYTPPSSASILPGLTREVVITLAKEQGLTIKEESIAREALYLADEIFMTGTGTEIVFVKSVDAIAVSEGQLGPITDKIQTAFFGLFDGTTEDKWGWLTPVDHG